MDTPVIKVSDPDRVVKARFALAADDGAYLRQNVVPLQTAYNNNETDDAFSIGASNNISFLGESGRRGVLDALEQELESDKQKSMKEFETCLDYVSWLLSIKEVRLFAEHIFSQRSGVQYELQVLKSFESGDAMFAANKFKEIGPSGASSISVKISIAKVVMMIFGRCHDFMTLQRQIVVSGGVEQLYEAINKLTVAGSLSKYAFDKDSLLIPELEVLANKFDGSATKGNIQRTGTDIDAMPMHTLASATVVGMENVNTTSDIGTFMDYYDTNADENSGVYSYLKEKASNWFASLASLTRTVTRQQLIDGTATTSTDLQPSQQQQLPAAPPPPLPPPPSSSQSSAPPSAPPIDGTDIQRVQSDMCEIPEITSVSQKSAFIALSKGISQMREDGGVIAMLQENDKTLVERRRGITPFFSSGTSRRLPVRYGNEQDYWKKHLFPSNGNFAKYTEISDIRNDIDFLTDKSNNKYGPLTKMAYRSIPSNDGSFPIPYCIARGLCAKPPPHFKKTDSEKAKDTFQYNVPGIPFPELGKLPYNRYQYAEKTQTEFETEDGYIFKTLQERNLFENDLVPPDEEARQEAFKTNKSYYIEQAEFARWAPVQDTRTRAGLVGVSKPEDEAVATCVVYETLKDMLAYMESKTKDRPKKNLMRGAAAAAKVEQMQYMKTVFEVKNLDKLTPPVVLGLSDYSVTNRQSFIFLTRPVAVCFDMNEDYKLLDHNVLYPCDAGLAQFSIKNDLMDWTDDNIIEFYEPETKLILAKNVDALYDIRFFKQVPQSLDFHSGVLRRILKTPNAERNTIPIYVANPPTFEGVPKKEFKTGVLNYQVERKDPRLFCERIDHAAVLRYMVQLGDALENIDNEKKRINELKKTYIDKDGHSVAKQRRDVVWNDALREASISSDRLYAFVRQLSGVISESIDSVCMIDDGMLVQHQNKLRERRSRISERAASEHINLVKGVFAAVLRESGLTLGIGSNAQKGDIGELKVVSNTLRKQVSELAQGQGTEGFFGNSVRMEQLLSNGTGELTLVELFQKLQDVGHALQNAVAISTSEEQPYNGVSMDFLSAPRNSMMLRYKPEALAAIRQAFEIFQREFATRYGAMHTTISAYELMEGNDESLSTHFATFCAHMLVHSRMFGSSTAMYIGQWPSAANAQQLKIGLERLCRAAYSYRMSCSRPRFLDANGREEYFKRATSMQTRMWFR